MKAWLERCIDRWIAHRAFDNLFCFATRLDTDTEEHEQVVVVLDILRKHL